MLLHSIVERCLVLDVFSIDIGAVPDIIVVKRKKVRVKFCVDGSWSCHLNNTLVLFHVRVALIDR